MTMQIQTIRTIKKCSWEHKENSKFSMLYDNWISKEPLV